MTLVFAASNPFWTAIVADGRLTDSHAGVSDDEFPKVFVLNSPSLRLGVGFSGLASFPGFRMNMTLQDMVAEAVRDNQPDLDAVVDALRVLLDGQFESFGDAVPDRARPTCVLLAGYGCDEQGSLLSVGRALHNFDLDASSGVRRFAIHRIDLDPPSNFVSAIGNFDGVARSRVDELQRLVDDEKPPEALVGKMVDVIREAAGRPGGHGIGSQCSSLIVFSDPGRAAEADYHTNVPSDRMFTPGLVTIDAEGEAFQIAQTLFVKGAPIPERAQEMLEEMSGFRSPGPKRLEFPAVYFPKVSRNAPCPCGIGKKYKHCHGR